MTPEAAKAVVGVARATYAEPIIAASRYQLAQYAVTLLFVGGFACLAHWMKMNAWLAVSVVACAGTLGWPSNRKALLKLLDVLPKPDG